MGKFNAVPSYRGKLDSEPDLSRYFGVEIEFDPDGHSYFHYRHALYNEGIDTFDDGCRDRRRMVGRRARPDPERLRTPPQCECCPEPDTSRGRHIQQCANIDSVQGREELLDALLEYGAEARLNEILPSYTAETVPQMLSSPGQMLRDTIAEAMPPITDTPRRLWNLGTDPTAGYELRTIPINMDEGGIDALARAYRALDGAGAVATGSCGTHVHQDMHDEDDQTCGRVAVAYRFLEPLLAAPVDPSRYFGGYNEPSWSGSNIKASRVKSVLDSKVALELVSSRWLNTAQISAHGTFEFRGLEGTLDTDTVKNYIVLLNRFIQATKHGDPWGLRLKEVVPIGVTADSIRAFFHYLDIVRSDVSDDLKTMRDWYIERVRRFRERNAFRNSLVTGSHSRTEKFADIRKLREEGKVGDTTVFEELVDEEYEVSDREIGMKVLRIIDTCIINSSPSRNPWRSRTSRNANEYTTYEEIFESLRGVLLNYDTTTTLNTPNWSWCGQVEESGEWYEFVDALETRNFEVVGEFYRRWFMEHDNATAYRSTFSNVISYWLSDWATAYMRSNQISDTLNGGDNECVDF